MQFVFIHAVCIWSKSLFSACDTDLISEKHQHIGLFKSNLGHFNVRLCNSYSKDTNSRSKKDRHYSIHNNTHCIIIHTLLCFWVSFTYFASSRPAI